LSNLPGTYLLVLLAVLPGACLTQAAAQTPDWPFDDVYDSDLVFLHPLANYRPNPHWVRDWERGRASGNSVWATVGSVSQKEFFTDVRMRIDQPLGDTRFRFLYDLRWLGGEHVDLEVLQQFLGLEMSVAGPWGLQALVHPTPDKADVDAALGVIVADESRGRFLRVSLRLDDLLYGDRNKDGGVSQGEPVGVQWEGRYGGRRWEVYSEGHYGSQSKRSFPDSANSPDIRGLEGSHNASQSRLRWLRTSTDFLELEFTHYAFLTAEQWRDTAESFRYEDQIVDLTLRYAFTFGGGRWRAWPGVHLLNQRARATGRQDERFERTDLMPQVFVEYSLGEADALEFGFMGSRSERTLSSEDSDRAFDKLAWSDKVKLGWTHHFAPAVRIQLSLSHEVAPDRFGGANVQFFGLF